MIIAGESVDLFLRRGENWELTYGLLGDDLGGRGLHGLLLSGSVDLRHVEE